MNHAVDAQSSRGCNGGIQESIDHQIDGQPVESAAGTYGGKVVDDANGITASQKSGDNVTPDETRAASHQTESHPGASIGKSGRQGKPRCRTERKRHGT